MPFGDAQLALDLKRSPTYVPSIGMLRRIRLRAIRSGFPTENFEKKIRGREILRSKSREIAPKSVRHSIMGCRYKNMQPSREISAAVQEREEVAAAYEPRNRSGSYVVWVM